MPRDPRQTDKHDRQDWGVDPVTWGGALPAEARFSSLNPAPHVIRAMLSGIQVGSLRLTLPGDESHMYTGSQPGPIGHMVLHRPAMLRKTLIGGAIGIAESYMDGDWDSPKLADTLRVLMLNQAHYGRLYDRNILGRVAQRLRHGLRRNSRDGSRKNIEYHYDLGNDFYSRWLDDTMAYSSAIFERWDQPLFDAQMTKFGKILNRLDLTADHHLLEIGSGWGGFAIFAAQHTGCRVTSITLSKEQLAEARRRAQAAGVADRVRFELRDYRDVTETYDRVVSIEMYEAVGEAYWDTYFDTIARVLKPGGVAAIQGITIDEAFFDDYRSKVDFIQRYIFPGGMLASPGEFLRRAGNAGLTADTPDFYGKHYAETLRRWDQAVMRESRAIIEQFGLRFLRMWHYYLCYCECGFDDGRIDLMHVGLRKAG